MELKTDSGAWNDILQVRWFFLLRVFLRLRSVAFFLWAPLLVAFFPHIARRKAVTLYASSLSRFLPPPWKIPFSPSFLARTDQISFVNRNSMTTDVATASKCRMRYPLRCLRPVLRRPLWGDRGPFRRSSLLRHICVLCRRHTATTALLAGHSPCGVHSRPTRPLCVGVKAAAAMVMMVALEETVPDLLLFITGIRETVALEL